MYNKCILRIFQVFLVTGEIKMLTTVPPLLLWLAGPCLRSWQTAPEVPPSRSLLPPYTFLEPKGSKVTKDSHSERLKEWGGEKKKTLMVKPYTVCKTLHVQAHQLLSYFILGVRVHGVLAAGVPVILLRSVRRERRLVPACRWVAVEGKDTGEGI